MKIRSILACLLGSAMLLQAMPAAASYQSADEIALAVRPMSAGDGIFLSETSRQIFVSPAAAAAGTEFHAGVFIEAERAELSIITMDLVSGSPSITFVEDTFRNPKLSLDPESSVYHLPDGTAFETPFFPYCLGTLSEKGRYNAACYSMGNSFQENGQRLRVTWQYGPLGNAETFLGGASDAFSLVEMDVKLAGGIAPGEYQIGFDATDSVAEDENKSRTIITSNTSVENGKSAYADLVPGLKPLTVTVAPVQLDGAAAAFCRADETAHAVPADIGGTAQRLQDGTLTGISLDDPAFSYAAALPASVTTPETAETPLLYDGAPVVDADGKPVSASYRIGCRGDVDLDGSVSASDAARILIFAAQKGAGGEPHLAEGENDAFAQYLGDVNGTGAAPEINASDAACILIYAAVSGSGRPPDWQQILGGTV